MVDGDISFKYKDLNFNDFFIEKFEKYVSFKINDLLNRNKVDTSQSSVAKLSINNILSYDDYTNSRRLITNLVGTKDIDIDSFAFEKISYTLNIYGDFNNFVKEISDNNFLIITNIEYSKNIIDLDLNR